MLTIRTLGDEVLASTCAPVTEFNKELEELVRQMFATMDEADGVGLAAPQVGVEKRLFVVDTRKIGERIALINPEIIGTSEKLSSYNEGCLSVPGVFCDVVRPERVRVQAQDLDGKAFVLDASALLARVIQHENDHLDGKLFIDRLSEKDREAAVKKYVKKLHKAAKKEK